MIPLAMVNGYSTLLSELSTRALIDLRKTISPILDASPEVKQRTMRELLPVLGNQYAGMTSLISAQFFTELQQVLEIRNPIDAQSLAGPDADRWDSLAGWATRPAALEQGGNALMFSLLSGGLTRILTEMAADTMIGNAEAQGGMGYQRVPKPGCCAFCGMLASRGAAYTSKESAGTVVGRGVPLEKTKGRRGGQGRGINPRGSRRLGESFHDHCRCAVVAVTPQNAVQMQSDADRYLDTYRKGYKQAQDGKIWVPAERTKDGSRSGTGHWETPTGEKSSAKDRTSQILQYMRAELDVK